MTSRITITDLFYRSSDSIQIVCHQQTLSSGWPHCVLPTVVRSPCRHVMRPRYYGDVPVLDVPGVHHCARLTTSSFRSLRFTQLQIFTGADLVSQACPRAVLHTGCRALKAPRQSLHVCILVSSHVSALVRADLSTHTSAIHVPTSTPRHRISVLGDARPMSQLDSIIPDKLIGGCSRLVTGAEGEKHASDRVAEIVCRSHIFVRPSRASSSAWASCSSEHT